MPEVPKKMDLKDLVDQVENKRTPNPVLKYAMMLCGIGCQQ